ncbi:MAG TPA: hypothetical protein VK611_07090 [Acidimicrobiales bacterium]|nr:hypothetical protein [Acidimicrobiales bacterium]
MLGVDRPPASRVLLALGLVTACTLGFQVIFTRLISSVMAYHFSFLAVSLALLGTGAGALLIYVRPQWFDGRPLEVNLARWAAAYGVLLVASPFGLVQLDYSIDRGITLHFALSLTAVCILAAAPSLAAGAVVALAIRGYAPWVGRVYAWDLVGAGIGALAVVPLLRFPAPELLVGLGVLALFAAVLFAWSDAGVRRVGAILTGGAVALLAVASLSSLLYLPSGYEIHDGQVADTWHPLSRVQGFTAGGGQGLLFYDRVYAPVPAVADGDDLPTWEQLSLGPASIGYEMTGPGHALVIGGGGGRDIYNALTSDQTVDVIELNSAIRDVVDDGLGELSGSPYSREGVSTTIGDGRAILASRDTTYDQIHIGFTDTLSANSAQGFALTENNLYTLEAFEEYLDHLEPGGVLNVSRLERLVGDEAIRATVLTMAALENHGVEDPYRNVVVIRGIDPAAAIAAPYATVLARLEPWTDAELDDIRRLADERGDGVAYAPGGPYYSAWQDLADADGWKSFCEGYELDVCPPTDNKPFFFNMRRPGDIVGENSGYHYGVDPYQLLMVTLLILAVLSVVGFMLPLWLARGTERPRLPSLFYFAAIGMGFMLLETVLIQRFVLFLGFPTYALSVVLFALLIFTGIGSAISGRLAHTRRSLTAVLGGAVALIVVSAFALQPLVRVLIDQPFSVRVLLTIVLLAPTGLILGMPMPIGLTRFSALYPSSIPYAWGVNGIASVLASVLGVTIALNFGYVVASLVAAACYVFALVHSATGRWSESVEAEPPGDTDEPDEPDAVPELATTS